MLLPARIGPPWYLRFKFPSSRTPFAEARQAGLKRYFRPDHRAIASINSRMQCVMKEICAQCLQRHRDPVTGTETVVFVLLHDAGRLLTLDELARWTEAFSDSDLPYRVDVVDWQDLDDRWRAIIAEPIPSTERTYRDTAE